MILKEILRVSAENFHRLYLIFSGDNHELYSGEPFFKTVMLRVLSFSSTHSIAGAAKSSN